MSRIFIEVLNHSLSACFLIAAVIVVRAAIKKAPKWISCALWGLVALKLILPFSIESVLSLVPSAAPIPEDIVSSEAPHIESGIPAVNHAVNPIIENNFTPGPAASVNPMQTAVSICAVIWAAGMAVMLLYLAASYLLLKKRVAASKMIRENVYICDEIASPFILGALRPRIYLPSGLEEVTKECVLEHEKTHLKRLDHLWKPVGYLILTVYWFNPLCWIAYILLCKDIELACDEKATKDRDKDWKAVYCQALLDCSMQRKVITACPVAFGEVGIKDRIKSVLHYKKPAFWIIFSAVAVSILVAVCFVTSPKTKEDKDAELTMEKLIELCATDTWEEDQRAQGISYWEKFENVQAQKDAGEDAPLKEEPAPDDPEELSELYTCRLESGNGTYELNVYCWTEAAQKLGYTKGAIERIFLYNTENGDGILLYAEDTIWNTDTNIQAFLTKKYNEIPDSFRSLPLAVDENGELHTEHLPRITMGEYRDDLFLNFSGCLFESESYEEPQHGEGAPESWYALGGVGLCSDPNAAERMTFSVGKLTAYDYEDNHMGCEKIADIETGSYAGCLYRYEMDLFTAPEMISLQPGIPTTGSCFAAFLTEGPENPLYAQREAVYQINCARLHWRAPEWAENAEQAEDAGEASAYWGDQRDWPFGTITEVGLTERSGLGISISFLYYIHPDNTQLVEKLGLTEDDFPSGIDIEPMGETGTYGLDEACEYILLDETHMFEGDERVARYDDWHIVTSDYSVFAEYMDIQPPKTNPDWNNRFFFYNIEDRVIKAIYEPYLP